ncbi:MAG: hypothetical protein ACM359_17230 [Bacillota bacterium]
MSRMFTSITVAICVITGLSWAVLSQAQEQKAPAQPQREAVRVGTYDPRALIIIYYGSKAHDNELRALIAERDKAKAAGDQKKVAELEAQGEAQQHRAHQMMAGKAPVDEIVAKLNINWADIANAAGVDVIVSKVEYKREGTQLVDVTQALVDQLKPGEKQRKWIQDLERLK